MVTKNETPAEMEARLRAEITASLAPQVQVPPIVVASTETAEQMEARIRGGITASNAEIASLCAIAGKPELAATFLAEGKTPTQVRETLAAAAATQQTAQQSTQAQAALRTQSGASDPDAGKDMVAVLNEVDIWANYNKGGRGTPVKYAQH